jgi:8-oxo-dGTP pyrophosphatase MutT (NUDIX family)
MFQNYTIFIDGNALSLVHNPQCTAQILFNVDGKESYETERDIVLKTKSILDNLLIEKNKQVSLHFYDINQLLEVVKLCFPKHIIAAGGVVVNDKGDILFIFRNGYWDLPKGKVEPEENLEAAALREIQEETGIVNATLIRSILPTFHTYYVGKTLVLKETRWFEIHSNDTRLTPQTEEGITELKWINPTELPDILNKSYENIRLLLSEYLKKETV